MKYLIKEKTLKDMEDAIIESINLSNNRSNPQITLTEDTLKTNNPKILNTIINKLELLNVPNFSTYTFQDAQGNILGNVTIRKSADHRSKDSLNEEPECAITIREIRINLDYENKFYLKNIFTDNNNNSALQLGELQFSNGNVLLEQNLETEWFYNSNFYISDIDLIKNYTFKDAGLSFPLYKFEIIKDIENNKWNLFLKFYGTFNSKIIKSQDLINTLYLVSNNKTMYSQFQGIKSYLTLQLNSSDIRSTDHATVYNTFGVDLYEVPKDFRADSSNVGIFIPKGAKLLGSYKSTGSSQIASFKYIPFNFQQNIFVIIGLENYSSNLIGFRQIGSSYDIGVKGILLTTSAENPSITIKYEWSL